MSSMVTNNANQLKYLSINSRIDSPNFQISHPTKKNLADRLTNPAKRNIRKLISNAPAEIVNTLNGIGVKPAVKIIQKFHLSYIC